MTPKQLIDIIKTAFRISTPWKKNWEGTEEYRKGWNDCIKESKKEQKKFIQFIEQKGKESYEPKTS